MSALNGAEAEPQVWTYVWRLGVTLFFVALNGFFVAAEFALVKVRGSRLEALASEGNRRARSAHHIYQNLDHYLSACQLGITVASLVLGWLAEPAVAELLLVGAARFGIEVSAGPWVHGIALAIALAIVTILHMVIGEQAPKMWAIHRSEATTLQTAGLLRGFAWIFRPLIWLINTLSNELLRFMGLAPGEHGEAVHTVDELRAVLVTSTHAGHISERQRELTENVLRLVEMEVRHILLPRVDAVVLSLQNGSEENLRIMREMVLDVARKRVGRLRFEPLDR